MKPCKEELIKFWCCSYSQWPSGSHFGFPLHTTYYPRLLEHMHYWCCS